MKSKLTPKDLANLIDEHELDITYRFPPSLINRAKMNNLLIAFISDTAPEPYWYVVFEGIRTSIIPRVIGEYKTVYFGDKGILKCNACISRVCSIPRAQITITSDEVYQGKLGLINMPFATFNMYQNGEKSTQGLVFSLSEIFINEF